MKKDLTRKYYNLFNKAANFNKEFNKKRSLYSLVWNGTINGSTEVGGIAGYADRATITNRGNVTGAGNYGVGGILGFDACNKVVIYPQNGSTITGCSNYGTVQAPIMWAESWELF